MQVRMERNNLSGNNATLYTLKKIREYIEKGKISPVLRRVYSDVLSGIDGRDSIGIFKRIYGFVQHAVRYQKDINEVETLQSAERTLELGFGDCDDQSILTGALIEGAGYQTRIVLVSNSPDKLYHHVFIQAFDGLKWVTIDTTEDYIGYGYNQPLTALYIEGKGANSMGDILFLDGMKKESGGKTGFMFPVLMGMGSNGYSPVRKKPYQKAGSLSGMYYDKNLGWGFKSIVKAVSAPVTKVVSNPISTITNVVQNPGSIVNTVKDSVNPMALVNQVKSEVESVYKDAKQIAQEAADIAKDVASGALSVVQLTMKPLNVVAGAINHELKKLPYIDSVVAKAEKIANGVQKTVNSELTNAIKNIDDPRKALLQLSNYSGYFPPQIGVPLAFVAQFVNNPTIDTEKLAVMAAQSVKIPGTNMSVYEAYMLAKKLKEIAQNPKSLLTVGNAMELAKAVGSQVGGVSPETMKKIETAYGYIKTAKEYYDKGMAIADKIQNIERTAMEFVNDATGQVVQAINNTQKQAEKYVNDLVKTAAIDDKIKKYTAMGQGVIDVATISKDKILDEVESMTEIIKTEAYQKLPVNDRINRSYQAILGRAPSADELTKYSGMVSPETVMLKDLYSSPEFQKLEEAKNAKIYLDAQGVATKKAFVEMNPIDVNYYANAYPDLKAAFGDNTEALKNHWIENGFSEGRIANQADYDRKIFLANHPINPEVYRNTYSDLKNMDDNSLVNHWIAYGFKEGRIATAEAKRAYIEDFIRSLEWDEKDLQEVQLPYYMPAPLETLHTNFAPDKRNYIEKYIRELDWDEKDLQEVQLPYYMQFPISVLKANFAPDKKAFIEKYIREIEWNEKDLQEVQLPYYINAPISLLKTNFAPDREDYFRKKGIQDPRKKKSNAEIQKGLEVSFGEINKIYIEQMKSEIERI